MDDRPETKYLNRYIIEEVCASGPEAWSRLGNELLEEKDAAALNVIKSNVTGSTMRCAEMFRLWLERQPDASWRRLITAMKKIRMHTLASDVEKLLASKEAVTVDQRQILQEGQHTYPSLDNVSYPTS